MAKERDPDIRAAREVAVRVYGLGGDNEQQFYRDRTEVTGQLVLDEATKVIAETKQQVERFYK